MAQSSYVSDEQLTRALGIYSGMVDQVIGDPRRWLGLDDDPPPTARFPARVLDALRDRAFGETTPSSPRWSDLPVQQRVDWWVTRIGVSAGLAAAAPRLAGALADRVPLQAALGASAAGLAVCATAREHGRSDPAEWVPLLGAVLFDRDLSSQGSSVPTSSESEQQLAAEDEGAGEPAEDPGDGLRGGARRAARTVWRLARTLWDLQGLLDERPRGGLLPRALAKLPVIGLAGGWLDERGGIRQAARQTTLLLAQSPAG
ncbi:hypothetical protein [Auraticoccus monumenti]|uniref:Uncharacterized protein n=1 Tax=Auraticoccus monumenti TaxID=675864 RepID=A0A1G6RJF6_9ACTN|nr:hypothetical protein [Auraticoccus monumenti]SDD04117.1 hypothetical protein SAMN04489747_0029 [Auraticoccus monumenti]